MLEPHEVVGGRSGGRDTVRLRCGEHGEALLTITRTSAQSGALRLTERSDGKYVRAARAVPARHLLRLTRHDN